MRSPEAASDGDLYDAIDDAQLVIAKAQRAQLRAIHEFDKRELWLHDGCYHMGQWLAGRLGITVSEGMRRTNAAHVLENLPFLGKALENGTLSLEKVVQLARFATPETERKLISWARRRSLNAVRDRAILETRRPPQEARDAHEARYLRFYPLDEIGSIGLDGRLPAAHGALVAKTIEEIAKDVPETPAEDIQPFDDEYAAEVETAAREQRQADALMALVLGRIGEVKPTLVVHTSIDSLTGNKGSEIEDGSVIHAELARRIACDAKLRVVLDDEHGNSVAKGSTSYIAPPAMKRDVMRRDKGCVFCGTRRFVDVHHVVPWPKGPTRLDNLVALCSFHHDLVHQGGWRVELDESQMAVWYRPDGRRYEPGLRLHRKGIEHDDGDEGQDENHDRLPETSGPARLALVAAAFR